MGKYNDSSQFDKILADDRVLHSYRPGPWANAAELHASLGPRPLGHYLAKRSQDLPHGPGNTFWALTLEGKKEQRRQEMRDLQSRHMPKPRPPNV